MTSVLCQFYDLVIYLGKSSQIRRPIIQCSAWLFFYFLKFILFRQSMKMNYSFIVAWTDFHIKLVLLFLNAILCIRLLALIQHRNISYFLNVDWDKGTICIDYSSDTFIRFGSEVKMIKVAIIRTWYEETSMISFFFSATAAERSSGNVSRRATVLSSVVYVSLLVCVSKFR